MERFSTDVHQPGLMYAYQFLVPLPKTVSAFIPKLPRFLAMPEVFAATDMAGLLAWMRILTSASNDRRACHMHPQSSPYF